MTIAAQVMSEKIVETLDKKPKSEQLSDIFVSWYVSKSEEFSEYIRKGLRKGWGWLILISAEMGANTNIHVILIK